MIGDHPIEDVGAATAAGVDAVWIDTAGTGVAADRPAPRYVVRTLPDVGADPRRLTVRAGAGTGRRSSRASIACAAAGWR